MGTRKTRDLPAGLEELRRRFERWRGTHRARSRIPEPLWDSAVKMAGTYGLSGRRGRAPVGRRPIPNASRRRGPSTADNNAEEG
jgi:hypothetical protein